MSYLSVNKFHDLFTSCLPAPQKGDPVEIGIVGTAPVTGTASLNASSTTYDYDEIFKVVDNASWASAQSFYLKVGKTPELGALNLANPSTS